MPLTFKQLEFKEDEYLLDLAENYAKNHPKFNPSFIQSLRSYCMAYNGLRQGQRDALLNIIVKYRMG